MVPNALRKLGKYGEFKYGDYLNRPSTVPEPQTTTAKRTSDVPPEKPSKRQRTEDDTDHHAYSVPSSSEVVKQPPSAGSSCRRGPQDSSSQRSSGDRRRNSMGIDSLRKVEGSKGLSSKRPRHRNTSGRPSISSMDDGRGGALNTTPSNAYKSKPSKPSLIQFLEHPSDSIEDGRDEEGDVTFLKETQLTGANGRPIPRVSGKLNYTASFMVPDVSSDDELGAPPPTVPQPQPAEQDQGIPGEQAKSRRKRAAEHDGNQRQPERSAKRRPDNSSRADMNRTQFSSRATHTQGEYKALRLSRAVCETTYVYPAEGAMCDTMEGASNQPCLLVPVMDGPLRFEAVDEKTRKVIPQLEWITPSIAKIQSIKSNPNSGIIKITKLMDFATKFATGRHLLLEFKSLVDAQHYIHLCCKTNKNIVTNTSNDIMEMSNLLDNKFREIMRSNMQKTSPPPPPTVGRTDDIHVLERKPERNMANRQPQDQQAKGTARTKPLREQMKDDDATQYNGARPRSEPRQGLTPALEKHIRDVVDDNYDLGHQQNSHDGSVIELRTPSRLNGHEHEPRSQRSLRSTKPNAKSPSPALERWTEKHRDWVNEWKTDLVYERTTVGKGDIERLDEGHLLNDEIISFYVKYLHKQLEKKDQQLANKVYVFNSFFWDKLKSKKGDINYDGVKNWTAKVDLLSFDYIIVPINENAHWYLAIICNAKGLLHQDEPEPEAEGAVPREGGDQARGSAESASEDSVKKIAVDVSHISIEDEPVDSTANHPSEDDKSSAPKASKASKKRPGLRKNDPKAPKVITLDSLGGQHSSVVTALKRYLQSEIKHKKGLVVRPPNTFGTTAKDIPCQPNFTDCGVYLLGYMQEFMKNPDRFTSSILQSKRDWDVDAPALRNRIRDLIFKLQKEFQDEEDCKRRQRALANRKQPPMNQAARTSTLKTPAESPNAQPAETPSASASASASDAHSRQKTSSRAKSSPLRDADKEVSSVRRDIHSLPPPAGNDSQETSSIQSQSSGVDTFGNPYNVSMIVNFDESMERANREIITKSKATPQQPIKSIEGDDQKLTPAPSRLPGSRQAPQSPGAKTPTPAPGMYEGRFLEPISSSPASSDTITKGRASRGGTTPGKNSNAKPNTKSPYFQKSAPGTGSVQKHNPARGRVTKVVGIPSSDTESDGVKKNRKKKPSSTIDLTLE